MNAPRRKAIAAQLAIIGDAKNAIEALKDEEQDYYDNMPESFQSGEKGEAASEAISELESAISNLDDAISELENIQ